MRGPTMPKKKTTTTGKKSRSATAKPSQPATVPQPDKRRLDCTPSRDTDSDWQVGQLFETRPDLLVPEANLPEHVDLRVGCDWWHVANQESTGGCVGWALADSVMRWHFVRAQKLPPDQPLSPRFLWMAAKETDEFIERPETFIEGSGTSLKAALDIARRYGCVTENILGFKTNTLYQGSPEAFYFQAAHFKISAYVRLGTEREWLRWLATPGRGPIFARLEVDQTFHAPINGRLNLYNPYPSGSKQGGGHAVAIVGYEKRSDFIIRNSWGQSWGNNGYAVASSSYVRDAITEVYGVFLL